MSQPVYLIFLLITFLTVISTPTNASPLEKRGFRECCPISACVFKPDDNPLNLPTNSFGGIPSGMGAGYNGNTFDGFLSFTETPRNSLQITGFINVLGAIKTGSVESVYDIHVGSCSSATSPTPGDDDLIDLDEQSFGKPIIASRSGSIDKLRDNCCFVVEEFAFNNGGGAERILGVAKVVPILERNCKFPTSANVTAPAATASGGKPEPTS